MAGNHFTIDQAYLWRKYWYNPVTGEMISRRTNRDTGWFDREYKLITLKDKDYKVHRLIWMYVYGRWPVEMIDHINGIKSDNRLCNLREVTAKQNSQNRRKIHAKSKLRGVVPASSGRWKCQIGHDGKTVYLGTYDTKEEAFDIYCRASKVFHTHNEIIFSPDK